MATERLRYVNPASTGGDGTTDALSGANAAYVSRHAALLAEYTAGGALTTSDEVVKIVVKGTGVDTVQMNGASYPFTTDDTRYVWIYVDPTVRHAGVPSSSVARWSPTASATSMLALGFHLKVEGEYLINTTGLASNPVGYTLTDGSGYLEVIDSILHATGAGTPTDAGAVYGAGTGVRKLYMRNCVVIGGWNNWVQLRFLSGASRVVLYNNTVVGYIRRGLFTESSGSGRVFVRNNRVDTPVIPGAAFYYPDTTLSSSGNYSGDATSPEGVGYVSKTFTWADSGNNDYHITSGDTFTGADLSADATYPFTTDVDGDTRTSWFAGFDEYVAAGPTYVDMNDVVIGAVASGGAGSLPLVNGGLIR